MKLGKKDVTELYLELEREREVRQNFIADTWMIISTVGYTKILKRDYLEH